MFMTLLASFKVVLARYSGQEDRRWGRRCGRPQAAMEGVIGFFVNTLVVADRYVGRPSFREVVAVRERCLNAYAHQDVPFEKLVEVLQPGA